MDFVDFYNNQKDYQEYRNNPIKRSEYEAATNWKTRQLCSLVPSTNRVNNILEIGCAFGVLLNKVSELLRVEQGYGLDIAASNIALAEIEFPHLKFIVGTADQVVPSKILSEGSNKFDLLLLSDIIEHIPDDLEFLLQTKNLARFVLINLPLEKCYKTRKRNYGESDASGHIRCYDLEDGLNLIKNAGLSLLSFHTAYALSDKELYETQRRTINLRLQRKSILKKYFWSVFYYFQMKLVSFPKLYTFLNGTNLFAYCATD